MNGLLSFQVLFMLTVYTAIMVPFEIVYELAQEDVFVGIIDLCVDTAFIIGTLCSHTAISNFM